MLFCLKIEILDRIIKVIYGLFGLMVRLLKHEVMILIRWSYQDIMEWFLFKRIKNCSN